MDPSGSGSRHGRLLISPSLSTPTFSSTRAPSASPSPHHDRRNSISSPTPLLPFPSPTSRQHHSSGASASAAGPRAAAGSASPPAFAHNARVAAALAPAAAFLLDLGGLPIFAVLAIRLAAAYLLDALRLRQGAFFTVWAALLAADVAFFFSASLSSAAAASLPRNVLALLLCAETSFLIGVWASLQFRWIQLENPTIVAALERLLFACVPIAAPAVFTWVVVSTVGMANASYYLATFAMVFYWLFSIPRPSSFKNRKQDTPLQDSDGILGPLELCACVVSVVRAGAAPLAALGAPHLHVPLNQGLSTLPQSAPCASSGEGDEDRKRWSEPKVEMDVLVAKEEPKPDPQAQRRCNQFCFPCSRVKGYLLLIGVSAVWIFLPSELGAFIKQLLALGNVDPRG